MPITNQNPMVATTASLTASVFSSTPFTVTEILWTGISSSCSLNLFDMDYNSMARIIADPGTVRVVEDPKVFANGLRFSTSTNLENGILYVWVR